MSYLDRVDIAKLRDSDSDDAADATRDPRAGESFKNSSLWPGAVSPWCSGRQRRSASTHSSYNPCEMALKIYGLDLI